MDILEQSISQFNDFCERTQQEELNPTFETFGLYKQLIDNVVRNLYQIPQFNDCFIVLYTESLFNALDTIRFFQNGFLFDYNGSFMRNNPTAPDAVYYNAIRRENGGAMNIASRSRHAASLSDHRAYRRLRQGNGSICEERQPVHVVQDATTNLVNNTTDAYTTYTANLIAKELVELHNGEEFNVPLMLIKNQKFFNKIAIIRNFGNTIINNRLFDLQRQDLQIRNDAFYHNNQALIRQMTRSHNVGLGGMANPAYWGNRITSTVIWHNDINDPNRLAINNSRMWINQIKNQTRFNNLPDNFFTDYREYGAIFLNAYQRHNSEFHIYMPLLRTGYSADLSDNSTISYYHKFSHQLFAGGYQTLGFGPVFYSNNNYVYNPCLLDAFSLNYRTSPPINQLISNLQRGQADPIQMTNAQMHRAWQNRYDELMERYYSIVKSVEQICNIGLQIQNNMNGILPLIHRLPLFHGSEVNLFEENGQYTYTRGFLSCTTTIDIALTFADRGNRQLYVYLILIEEGEHCPFINMGNMFREFTIPPGVILTRVGEFTLPQLNWTQPNRINGNNTTFILVRPAIGNFIQEFTRLVDIANMWEGYMPTNTCHTNCVYENNPHRQRVAQNMSDYFNNRNRNRVSQNTDDLRIQLRLRIPAAPLQIGGSNKKSKNFEKLFKNMGGKNDPFTLKKNESLFKRSRLPKTEVKMSKSISDDKSLSIYKKDELEHFNSLTKYGLFETFKTKAELQEFVINENQKIKDQILTIRKKIEESKKVNKKLKIKSQNENIFDLSLLDKKGNDVFDKETQKILSLAGKGTF
tara:strand:+ start:29 stop:2449 length:2421 start_codon:yes stop_codon:yes gene_type:complete